MDLNTLYLVCAVAGGTVLVVQVFLLLVGFDTGGEGVGDIGEVGDVDFGDAVDVEVTEDASGYHVDSGEGASGDAAAASFKFLSFKTLVAFFTFFGLTGLLAENYELGVAASLTVAVFAGLVAFYIVGYVWMALYRLQSRGNIDIRNALGAPGRVYLSIPGKGAGRGKITVQVQGRLVEVSALTSGEPIATGTQVRVVGLAGSDTVKVVPLEDAKEATHG